MSRDKSHKVSYQVVKRDYKGYDIIRVTTTYFHRSIFSCEYTSLVDRVYKKYTFCKTGLSNRPSQLYDAYADTCEKCCECIDEFLKDDSLYFTAEEREKWVHKPNRKNGWGFSYDSIMRLMRQHQKGDKRIKRLLEDRLTDANFHSYCSLISDGKYKEFEELAARDLTITECYYLEVKVLRKGIKDPKRFEEGLSKVISDYFKTQKLDTSVCVKYHPWE